MLIEGKMHYSLVGTIMPLVGFNKTQNIPFVRYKLPLNPYSGFTLVEIMVTLLVVGVLVLFAVPSMRGVLQNSRMVTQSNALRADINMARSETIRRAGLGIVVRICTWNSAATPTVPTCNGGGNWSGGRIIWADLNANGALDAGEVVRSREGFLAPLTLNQIGVNVDPIIFNRQGGTASAINFSLCEGGVAARGKNFQLTTLGQILLFPTPPAACS